MSDNRRVGEVVVLAGGRELPPRRWGELFDMLTPVQRYEVELDRLLYGAAFVEVRDGKAERVDPATVKLRAPKPQTRR
jgi:hypothetical protein